MIKSLFHLFIFCICLFILSCNKIFGLCDSPPQPYKPLTSTIKLWLPYTKDTNILYENAILQSDTIYLRNFFYGDDNIMAGDECPPNRGQFLICNFIDKNSDDTIKTFAGYGNNFYTSRKSTRVDFAENINDVPSTTSYRRYDSSLTLNLKTFKDCIWVECTSNDNCNIIGITKYYFSKGNGLIGYIRNGVLWTKK